MLPGSTRSAASAAAAAAAAAAAHARSRPSLAPTATTWRPLPFLCPSFATQQQTRRRSTAPDPSTSSSRPQPVASTSRTPAPAAASSSQPATSTHEGAPTPYSSQAPALASSSQASAPTSSSQAVTPASPPRSAPPASTSRATAPPSIDQLSHRIRAGSTTSTILSSLATDHASVTLSSFGRLVEAALDSSNYDLAEALFQASLEHHQAKTTSKLLLLRSRAWAFQAEKGSRSWSDLDTFAELYRESELVEGGHSRAPVELFDWLFEFHAQRGATWRAQRVLRGMFKEGHAIPETKWLQLFSISPRLRPYVQEIGEKKLKGIRSCLLRLCTEKRDARASLLVLRLMGLRTSISSPDLSLVKVRPSFYAPLGVLSSYLTKPDHALRFYELVSEGVTGLKDLKLDEEELKAETLAQRQASEAVISAYNRSDQPLEALRFGSIVFGSPLLEDHGHDDVYRDSSKLLKQRPNSLSTSSLIRSATMLEPLRALLATRRILASYLAIASFAGGTLRCAFSHLVYAVAKADPTGEAELRYVELLNSSASEPGVKGKRLEALKAAYEAEGIEAKLRVDERRGERKPREGFQEGPARLAEAVPAEPRIAADDSHLELDSDGDGPRIAPPNTERTGSPSAYAVKIRHAAVAKGDIDEALLIYRRMISEGVAPNLLHIEPLVEGLTIQDRVEEARKIMGRVSELLNRPPTMRMFTALIRSLASQRKWREVKEELGRMREEGMEMDDVLARIVTRGGALYQPSMREPREVGVKAGMLIETRGKASEELAMSTPLSAIKSRFRDLVMAERHVEAQRVVQKAIDADVEADATLRDMIRSAGSRIESLIKRLKAKGEVKVDKDKDKDKRPEEKTPEEQKQEEQEDEHTSWQSLPKPTYASSRSSRPDRTSNLSYLEKALKAQRFNVERLREQAASLQQRKKRDRDRAGVIAQGLVTLAREAFVDGDMKVRPKGAEARTEARAEARAGEQGTVKKGAARKGAAKKRPARKSAAKRGAANEEAGNKKAANKQGTNKEGTNKEGTSKEGTKSEGCVGFQ